MLRRWTHAPAVALLVAAGLAFAVLGYRVLRLEREEADRQGHRSAEQALRLAAGRAADLAREPRVLPAGTWSIEEHDGADPLADTPEDRLVLFREAEFLERARGDVRTAYEILSRFAGETPPAALEYVAMLRAGILARRLGDRDGARQHLGVAAAAPDDLRTPEGPGVRLGALYHLLVMDRPASNLDRLEDLLRLTDEGRLLAIPSRPGPGDMLVALACEPFPPDATTDVRERLEAAACRARRGHRVLRALPSDGLCVLDDGVARRIGPRLEIRELSSLLDPATTDAGADIGVRRTSDPVPSGAVTVDLGPPLAGARLVTMPDRRAGSARLVTAGLAAGLVVYALGVLTTVLALRRSARTARMQTDFVAAVSHELKTPISSVRAMAELLADGGTDRAETYAERIGHEMERLGATVRNVLDTARIERTGDLPVSLERQDPASVVREIADRVRPRLERDGFEFEVDVRAASRPIPLDRAAMEGVLLNLVDNAAKFSSGEKSVSVRAGPVDATEAYRIEVLDRGIGIPASERGHLFERFFRGAAALRGAAPGVGLGLHVAARVVAAHGGSIRAEPREGDGSVFVIEIGGPTP